YKRTTCRLCDHDRLALVLPLGRSPVGGAFVRAEQLDEPQALYPLDLYQCEACGHVQLLDVVNPAILFGGDYSYFSGRSSLVNHFAKYADQVIQRSGLTRGAFVVDVGSNDGA